MKSIQIHRDPELGRLRDGYPALSRWICKDLDEDPLVFRKFGRLAARNILHLQCRLTQLEDDIDTLDQAIRTSTDIDTVLSLRSWDLLMERASVVDSLESKLVAKLADLQNLLQEYYETLSLRAQVSQLHKPSDRFLQVYKDFLGGYGIKDPKNSPMDLLFGRAKHFLSDPEDLVALQKPLHDDFLSRTLRNYWCFNKKHPSDQLDRTLLHEDRNVARFVAVLSMLLAATLLVGAIVSLYFVESEKVKLGLLATYTALFAASVKSCTDAKRAEVFAATAAYAAVLVVFVSGDLGGGKSGQCLVQLEGGIWKTVGCPG